MKKLFRIFSLVVLIITFLSLYGFSVRYVTVGGERLGIMTRPLIYFSSFPYMALTVLKSNEVRGIPPTYEPKDRSFEEFNDLEYDLYAINSFYNTDKDDWDLKLFNLMNDSVIHSWHLCKENYNKTSRRKFENSRPSGGLMLPDRSIIAYLGLTKNLYRLNRNSEIQWHNTDKIFHHSMELAIDGNIWICTSEDRHFKLARNNGYGSFIDDCITKINRHTGEILYHKSVTDILIENGYKSMVYGFTNTDDPSSQSDPLHLNDIQPVYEEGPHWKKGDLFLSLRHKSLVIHYRPGSNRIIRLLQGPFLLQHDVDIVSDSEIAIFNNNSTNIGEFDGINSSTAEVSDKLLFSELIIFNYRDSSYRKHLEHQFVKENIFSRTEGKYDFLSTGDVYVESQNDSKIYIMNDQEVVLKKQLDTPRKDRVYMLNLLRIYENIDF